MRQSTDFPTRSAHARAPYANGANVPDAVSRVYRWSVLVAGIAGQDADAAWNTFRSACLTGAWGASYSFNGYAFPDAVVLNAEFTRHNVSGYDLQVLFSGTPEPCYTPGPAIPGPVRHTPFLNGEWTTSNLDGFGYFRLPIPPSTQVGDVLILGAYADGGITGVPSGFTRLYPSTPGHAMNVYYRVVDGTEGIVNLVVDYPANGGAAFLQAWSDMDTAAPFGVPVGVDHPTPDSISPIEMRHSGLSPVTAKNVVMYISAAYDGGAGGKLTNAYTYDVPGTIAVQGSVNEQANSGIAVVAYDVATTGPTGHLSIFCYFTTPNTLDGYGGVAVELKGIVT